jgi:hypothetical protein
MSRIHLGEFEKLVLGIVAHMNGEAYGASITVNIKAHTGISFFLKCCSCYSRPAGRKRVGDFFFGRNYKTKRQL